MPDKAMEEVMREYGDKCREIYKDDSACIPCTMHEELANFIPKACRAYARKVVEELLKGQEEAILLDTETIKVILPSRAKAILDRLTDKEPT